MQQDRDGGHRHGNGGTRHRGDIKGAPHTGSACGQWACGHVGMWVCGHVLCGGTCHRGDIRVGSHGSACGHGLHTHSVASSAYSGPAFHATPPMLVSRLPMPCPTMSRRATPYYHNISLNTDQTVQGRGFALPGCMQLLDARHGPLAPAFLSLMREVSSKEAACLCRARGFGTVAVHSPMVATHGDSSRQSINQLAAALVEGLQVWMSGEGLVMELQA